MDKFPQIIEKDGVKLVSARELYDFLGVKKQFTQWFDQQKDWFIENQDFNQLNLKVNLPQGGSKNKIDYAITIDMAKELAMMSRVEKGKQVRQYFIECETKLEKVKEIAVQYKAPSEDELIIAGMKALHAKAERLETQLVLSKSIIKEQAPKVQYCEEVLQSESAHTTTVIAKELGMSAVELNKVLKERDIQMFVGGVWVLKAKYQNCDYTRTRTYTYLDKSGNTQTSIQTVWTEKGRKFIHDSFKMELAN